jgi:hypothetical protein
MKDGIELKGVKVFKGHDGEPCHQGNLYMDGKKIGRFSEDSHGGPMSINIINKEFEDEFYKRTKDYTIEYCGMILKGTDLFIGTLLSN